MLAMHAPTELLKDRMVPNTITRRNSVVSGGDVLNNSSSMFWTVVGSFFEYFLADHFATCVLGPGPCNLSSGRARVVGSRSKYINPRFMGLGPILLLIQ